MAATAQPDPQQPKHGETSDGGSASGQIAKTIGWFIAGIVAVAVACEMLIGLGRIAEKRLDEPFQKVGTLPPTMALLRTSTADGQHLKGCTLSRPVEVIDSFQNNRLGRRDRFGSDIATEFADQSHFLQCIAETSGALCDSEIRRAFASDVQRFLADYGTITPHMVAFGSDQEFEKVFSHIQNELSNAHPRFGSNFEKSREAPRDTTMEARERTLQAVKTATEGGLISKRDFGFFGNSEVKAAIAATPITQSLCSK